MFKFAPYVFKGLWQHRSRTLLTVSGSAVLVEKHGEEAVVWMADTAGHAARRRAVKLGAAGTDQLVEVVQGLSALDKLIVNGRDGLTDGTRIRVSGEDQTLGIASQANVVSTAATPNSPTKK